MTTLQKIGVAKLVTVTSTPEHSEGFVVPTFIIGPLGGCYNVFTCRDCDNQEFQGHASNCPQRQPVTPTPATGEGQ